MSYKIVYLIERNIWNDFLIKLEMESVVLVAVKESMKDQKVLNKVVLMRIDIQVIIVQKKRVRERKSFKRRLIWPKILNSI